MGIEVTDICMDKEPDCVIVYSNGGCKNSYEETVLDHCDADSCEHINMESNLEMLEENTDLKEYEVKECTVEDKVEISEVCQVVISTEQQNTLGTKIGSDFSEEKMNFEPPKDTKKSISLKYALKSAANYVRTNCTVPQPFALATEKRASCGTRPVGSESGMHKSSNALILQPSDTTKQNKVTACGSG